MEKITIGFKIKKAPGMTITELIIESETLGKKALDKMKDPNDPSIIKGELTVGINYDVITVVVRGLGDSFSKGTFNLTLDDTRIFKEDQDLKVLQSGRFDFFKTNVKLP